MLLFPLNLFIEELIFFLLFLSERKKLLQSSLSGVVCLIVVINFYFMFQEIFILKDPRKDLKKPQRIIPCFISLVGSCNLILPVVFRFQFR